MCPPQGSRARGQSLHFVSVHFAATVLLGCGAAAPLSPPPPAPPSSAWGETTAQATTSVGERGLDYLSVPARFSTEDLAAEREWLAANIPFADLPREPTPGAASAPLLVPDPRRVPRTATELQHLAFDEVPAERPPGRRVQAHQQLFASVPTAKLAPDGTLELSFDTTQPIPSAAAYFGTVMPDGALASTRYRRHSRELTSDPARLRHTLKLPLRKILSAHYDVNATRTTGRGVVAWRVEALDVAGGTGRIYDDVTAFRCDPAPCEADARFVQLPSLRLGPAVELVGPDRATIAFTTDVPTEAMVTVGAQGEEPRRFRNARPGLRHEIELAGLAPGTRYRYVAVAIDHRGETVTSRGATFETAPEDREAPLTFAFLSDARAGVGSADERYLGTHRAVLRGLLERALEHHPAFVLFIGDLVDGYTTEPGAFRLELEGFHQSIAPVAEHVAIYESPGNHDTLVDAWELGWAVGRSGTESSESVFAEYAVNPRNAPTPAPGAPTYEENVFSFDHGAVHVAVVNSNYWWRSHPERADHPAVQRGQREGWLDERQLEWLDADLGAARERGIPHLIVGTHEPAFPNGGHVHDAMYWNGKNADVLAQRARFLRVLAKHGVALLATGDEHNYSRTWVDAALVPGLPRPLWQIVSGGAGAPYYARDRRVPWADHVHRFDVRQHFVVVHVTGSTLEVEAIALSGESIDRFTIDAEKRAD